MVKCKCWKCSKIYYQFESRDGDFIYTGMCEDCDKDKTDVPSLQEYLNWALEPEDGFRTHEEIFNYFARMRDEKGNL